MPQIAKSGKYVFGWTIVHVTGKILIPKEAYDEYEFSGCEQIVLIPGSSTSGGFAITTANRLKNEPFEEILTLLDYSKEKNSFQIPELRLIKRKKNKYCCWAILNKRGYFTLSPEVLGVYGVKIGNKLLVVRGSGHALGFIARGRIVETAKMHPKLKIFK